MDSQSDSPEKEIQQEVQGSLQRDHSGEYRVAHPAPRPAGNYSHIKGWGADLDHANRPAYPRERTPPRLDHPPTGPLADQPLKMKIFHSVERSGITPIFGTSAPPSGVSGLIRSAAYKLSENDIRHWLLLLLADRVNVVEGIGQDLLRGKVPNVLAEMGIAAEYKHNPVGLVRKTAIAATVIGVGYYLLTRRGGNQKQ